MNCSKCDKTAVIELQHGALCRNHFIKYFEDKVFNTIKKYHLINQDDKIGVACSGGKDSQTVLHLVKKYLVEENLPIKSLFALAIDEGIAGYRTKTLKDLKKFCQQEKVKLVTIAAKKEFGLTLDQAIKKIRKKDAKEKPCHVCGVWRRYLINKYARKRGATKLITGHNLDDEAQAVIMNIFKANTSLMSHQGPITGMHQNELFVQRVKPLYFCTEKETKLYSLLKGFPVGFVECPYAEEGYRAQIRDMLNEFESKYHGTKQGIINSFLYILPAVKGLEQKNVDDVIKLCVKCGEPGNQQVCQACKIKERLRE